MLKIGAGFFSQSFSCMQALGRFSMEQKWGPQKWAQKYGPKNELKETSLQNITIAMGLMKSYNFGDFLTPFPLCHTKLKVLHGVTETVNPLPLLA